MKAESLTELLPWRYPFLLIDRVIEWVPGERVTTTKRIAGDDFMALAHRPGTAMFPGVLILEGMNQSAALLYRLTHGRLEPSRIPLVGTMRARFPGSAKMGDKLTYEVWAVRMTPTHALFEGKAEVEGRVIVEGEMAFAVSEESPKSPIPPRPPKERKGR